MQILLVSWFGSYESFRTAFGVFICLQLRHDFHCFIQSLFQVSWISLRVPTHFVLLTLCNVALKTLLIFASSRSLLEGILIHRHAYELFRGSLGIKSWEEFPFLTLVHSLHLSLPPRLRQLLAHGFWSFIPSGELEMIRRSWRKALLVTAHSSQWVRDSGLDPWRISYYRAFIINTFFIFFFFLIHSSGNGRLLPWAIVLWVWIERSRALSPFILWVYHIAGIKVLCEHLIYIISNNHFSFRECPKLVASNRLNRVEEEILGVIAIFVDDWI